MSYCRFSEGDVYMFSSIAEGIMCCSCSLVPKVEPDVLSRDPIFTTPQEAIRHLEQHKKAGDIVPDRAIEVLKDELDKEGKHG